MLSTILEEISEIVDKINLFKLLNSFNAVGGGGDWVVSGDW